MTGSYLVPLAVVCCNWPLKRSVSRNEYALAVRLYHELKKVVRSADNIFELLYLKNFVDS